MALNAGTRLGPYEIVSPLGAGGMGEVYRANDTRLERSVAVKVLTAHLSLSPELRQRFEREAKTISKLSHPHICAIYDVGQADGTDYLVMEYLEGETLTQRLARGPLPAEQVLRYGIEMAEALDQAHRQGIVHRDLKPGNVMVTKGGAKLLDFGLAKAFAPVASVSGATALPTVAGAADLTQGGTILGTFQYMAPEQLEGREADARTDIFALGCRALRDGHGPEGLRREEPGEPDRLDPEGRASGDLDDSADGASGPRPRRQDLPLQGPGRPLAVGARHRGGAEVDRGGLAGGCRGAGRGHDAPPEPRADRLGGLRPGGARRGRVRGGLRPARPAAALARCASRSCPPRPPPYQGVGLERRPCCRPFRRTGGCSLSTSRTPMARAFLWIRPLDSLVSAAASGNGRGGIPLLVSRQPFDRLLLRREAEEGRRLGRPGPGPL